MELILYLFASTVVLLATCYGELKIELKPRVVSITEVKSRHGGTDDQSASTSTNEPPETVRKLMCTKALEMVQREWTDKIRLSDRTRESEAQKYYLIELGGARSDPDNSFEIVPACKCPTNPSMYIQFEKYEGDAENVELMVIFKEDVPAPSFRTITAFDIRIVTDIAEAFAEEIQPEAETTVIESSIIDVDQLIELQRLKICQRAVEVVAEMEVAFLPDMHPTGRNKYYIWSGRSEENLTFREQISVERFNTRRHKIMQAFSCPTQTELYVHFNVDDHQELALWVILREQKLSPIFNILSYQYTSFRTSLKCGSTAEPHFSWHRDFLPGNKEICLLIVQSPATEELKQMMRHDPKVTTVIDFDRCTVERRREMCQKFMLAALGTSVKPSMDVEIGPTEFYRVNFEDAARVGDMRAIKCPTESGIDVYVHVNKYAGIGRNTCWVVLKKDQHSEKLSPWIS